MFAHALALLAGTVCLPVVASGLPSVGWAVLPAGVLLAALAYRRTRLAFFCAGLLWSGLQAASQLDHRLPHGLEGKDLTVSGRISSIPVSAGIRSRFAFEVERLHGPVTGVSPPRRIRLNLYDAQIRPRAGERWRLRVRLKRPYGFRNPGGFDYEAWLFHQGVNATGYVRSPDKAQRLAAPGPASLAAWRQRLYERLTEQVRGIEGGEIILALSLGVRDRISTAQWELLRTTGTSHLLAISGLHVGLIATLAFWLGHFLWSRSAALAERLAAPRAAAVLAIGAATTYAALAGFAIPTQRALIMVVLVCTARILARRIRPLHSLSLALIGVLVLDPFAVLSAGFWLSFLAVLVLILLIERQGSPRPRSRLQKLRSLVVMQFVLSLGLLPVTVIHFHQISWLAPVANFAAIPWVSLLMVPLVFLGLGVQALAGDWAIPLWALAGRTYGILEWWLALLDGLPHADWRLARPLWAALPAALAVPLWLRLRRGHQRAAAGCLVLPALLYRAPVPEPGALWVDVLDVGQGLAVVVRTRSHVLVYDTGPRYGSGLDTGTAVVAPFLEAKGVDALDALVISHGDNDHIGGARALTRRMPVGRVLTSVPEQIDWHPASSCRAGQSWRWDGVSFAMLHPGEQGWGRENNASCVLRITNAAGTRLLLTGDIEAAAERDLLRPAGPDLAAAVLLAPHHGSASSSTSAFIEQVDPEHVIFPAGRRNRYDFPQAHVLARYQQRGAGTWMTGCSGTISVRLESSGELHIGPGFRERARRFWHDRGCADALSAARPG